jgi:tetratricopeptide (TPR) repeat protein
VITDVRNMLDEGRALRREGRYSEAIRLIDAAVQAAPQSAEAWLERAYIFDFGGSLDNARASYGQAIRLGAGPPALAGFASVAVRQGDYERARETAKLALQVQPGEPTATIALARCELEAKDPAAAEALLKPLLNGPQADEERMLALGLLGDALDKLDRPADAFAAYTGAKMLFARANAHRFADRPPLIDFVRQVHDGFAAVPPQDWVSGPDATEGAAKNHVFLIGYPRSGTTLVENILASGPDVAALEERPTLRETDLDWYDPPERLDQWARLPDDALQPYRQAYWRRVAVAKASGAATLVDMDPLKGLKLPLIAKLFPQARIVVMRRDPRDVVLSCFRTVFAPTAAAYQFTSLEGVARHYDAMMRLQQDCFATLPLATFELRYPDLITDFDATTQALCDFTGVAWTEDLHRFDKTADRRGVSTASQTQVRRGLYDGRDQWRRYADQLAPVLPILQPWIDAFGF